LSNRCDNVLVVSSGLLFEPSLNPKPGGVTPTVRDEDKCYLDFLIHSSMVQSIMVETCRAYQEGNKKPLLYGLRLYRKLLDDRKINKNIAFGEFLLHLPFSIAINSSKSSRELAINSSSIVIKESGRDEGVELYRILRRLSPSYLGKYEGVEADINESYPASLYSVIKKYSWDLVFHELLFDYEISIQTKEFMERVNARSLRERFLWGLLYIISMYGDAFVAKKNGFLSYIKTRNDAKMAMRVAKKYGIYNAIMFLERVWRPMNVNPGASLDVLSSSISLYFYDKALHNFLE